MGDIVLDGKAQEVEMMGSGQNTEEEGNGARIPLGEYTNTMISRGKLMGQEEKLT